MKLCWFLWIVRWQTMQRRVEAERNAKKRSDKSHGFGKRDVLHHVTAIDVNMHPEMPFAPLRSGNILAIVLMRSAVSRQLGEQERSRIPPTRSGDL